MASFEIKPLTETVFPQTSCVLLSGSGGNTWGSAFSFVGQQCQRVFFISQMAFSSFILWAPLRFSAVGDAISITSEDA